MTDRPGPGGPWPLDPQVPPYEQPSAAPSYSVPSQPYSPPQPPAYPAEAPSFVPAGQYYQAQPYPGQPPYGPQPPVFMPGSDSTPDNLQPDRVPAMYGVMAIVAVVLIGVIGVGVAVWSISWAPKSTAASDWTVEPTATAARTASASSSPTPSRSKVGNCAGSFAETPDWQAVVPAGWSCEYQAGAEITVINGTYDTIMVQATNTGSAAAACSTDLAREATVTALPDSTWGGKVSKTARIKYHSYDGEARCAYTNGFAYVMVGLVVKGTLGAVAAGEAALAQSWMWNS